MMNKNKWITVIAVFDVTSPKHVKMNALWEETTEAIGE